MESKSKKKEVVELVTASDSEPVAWRRRCGCLRTSEKLRQILRTFPGQPPPPSTPSQLKAEKKSVVSYCQQYQASPVFSPPLKKALPLVESLSLPPSDEYLEELKPICCRRGHEPRVESTCSGVSKSWSVVYELVQLVQLSVTATALALYYLIYCYMQLVYFTLKSALYFHQADGPMKITIVVMTITSLVVGYNIVMRLEKIAGLI